MTNEVKPQDQHSGLVARSSERKNRKARVFTEQTLEGQRVKATWLDPQGHVQRAAGKVVRAEAGELAIESWADGVRRRTPVTRDANVEVYGRTGR